MLLVSFERELEKLVRNPGQFHQLESRYRLLFMPSWTGLFSPPLLRLAALSRQPFHVMPVNQGERALCHRLGPLCQPLPFNAASWVNEHFYATEPLERDIDCLMVANFAEFKRHWILFKALSQLPESVTATCVGVPWGGRTRESLLREAALYGVAHRVEVIENPPQEELRRYFKRAKLFCALSFREGSFIAVAEALMSGTPVVMFGGAHIGSKERIHDHNGVLVDSVEGLRKAIVRFRKGSDYSRIRDEAVTDFSATASCERLNALLREHTLGEGGHWSDDIRGFYSMRLGFYYRQPEDPAVVCLEEDERWLSGIGIRVLPH
ncbi:MAG: glycosyltransferase [Oleiphilaceae bacterium]|nr:glycosyltransferase [Oleiphilaceae bacterium]